MRQRFRSFNAAQVLLLIREREVKSFTELCDRLIPRAMSRSVRYRLKRQLQYILQHLESAGLIGSRDELLEPTDLIELVQNALDISLTDLSQIQHGAIPVSPVFGSDDLIETVTDVFVLMPFAENMRPIYEDHIRVAAEKVGLTVSRADDFFTAESIISDIWRAIYNSKILVADCTGRNPNVFYEIGIAHTVGRPTILISESIDDVPFDLRHRRCIVYEYTPRGMRTFTESLTESMRIEARRIGLRVDADKCLPPDEDSAPLPPHR